MKMSFLIYRAPQIIVRNAYWTTHPLTVSLCFLKADPHKFVTKLSYKADVSFDALIIVHGGSRPTDMKKLMIAS